MNSHSHLLGYFKVMLEFGDNMILSDYLNKTRISSNKIYTVSRISRFSPKSEIYSKIIFHVC